MKKLLLSLAVFGVIGFVGGWQAEAKCTLADAESGSVKCVDEDEGGAFCGAFDGDSCIKMTEEEFNKMVGGSSDEVFSSSKIENKYNEIINKWKDLSVEEMKIDIASWENFSVAEANELAAALTKWINSQVNKENNEENPAPEGESEPSTPQEQTAFPKYELNEDCECKEVASAGGQEGEQEEICSQDKIKACEKAKAGEDDDVEEDDDEEEDEEKAKCTGDEVTSTNVYEKGIPQ